MPVLLAGCAVPAARMPAPRTTLPFTVFEPLLPPPILSPAQALAAPGLSETRSAFAAAGIDPEQVLAGRTLLAPTNGTWARLAPGTLDALLLPGNRPSLLRLLRYWTILGRLTSPDLWGRATAATASGAPARLPSLEGEPLLVIMAGGVPVLTDARGRRATILSEASHDSSGALLVVDGIVAPASIEPSHGED